MVSYTLPLTLCVVIHWIIFWVTVSAVGARHPILFVLANTEASDDANTEADSDAPYSSDTTQDALGDY